MMSRVPEERTHLSTENKTKVKLSKIVLSVVSLLAFGSCAEDELEQRTVTPRPITVQFETNKSQVKENENAKTVQLKFSEYLKEAAIISIEVDTTVAKHFTTVPSAIGKHITLHAAKGATSTSFEFIPVNNAALDGNKLVAFTIRTLNETMQLGELKQLSMSIHDDEMPIEPAYVNFVAGSKKINEADENWVDLKLSITPSTDISGSALIEVTSSNGVYGVDYVTEPALSNNLVSLSPIAGSNEIKMRVRALNNTQISGTRVLKFNLKETSGNLKKGWIPTDSVTINDDELTGLPKGYTTGGGGWGMKKTYEYNSKGQISKVLWQTYTPYLRTGEDIYHYDSEDKLVKINTAPGFDLIYTYENGRIAMEKKVDYGVLKRYTIYDYDQAGNPAGFQIYHLQPDGQFALSSTFVFLYYTDGNLYKKMVYTHTTANPDEAHLVSTETFENYMTNKENPFPMVEVQPGFKSQKNLPTSYRVESNGHNLLYNISYEFNSAGKVTRRLATMGYTSDSATYEYY